MSTLLYLESAKKRGGIGLNKKKLLSPLTLIVLLEKSFEKRGVT